MAEELNVYLVLYADVRNNPNCSEYVAGRTEREAVDTFEKYGEDFVEIIEVFDYETTVEDWEDASVLLPNGEYNK